MELPVDRPLSDAELEIAIASAILNDQQNPAGNTPFGPSAESMLGRLGIAYHGDYIARFNETNGGGPNVAQRVAETCWRWVVAGLLIPTASGAFNPTAQGRLSLAEVARGAEPAFTVGGIASELKSRCAWAPDLILAYAGFSQGCFAAAQYEAAVVMLGAATELALYGLGDALHRACGRLALSSPRALHEGTALRRLEATATTLSNHGKELRDSIEAVGGSGGWITDLPLLLANANTIRLTRNDTGHPARLLARRDQAFSQLSLFPTLAEAMLVTTKELEAT